MRTKRLLKMLVVMGMLASFHAGAQLYILDQSQTDFGSTAFIQGTTSMAQTFTPSIAGDFAQLDLYLARDAYFETEPLLITITDTANGLPNNALGSATLSNISSDSRDWYSIDFSSQNILLSANTLYAFELSCPGSFYGITDGGSVNDSYPGGMSLVQDGTGASWQPYSRAPDLMFQTWMIPVPEPFIGTLIVLGFAFVPFICRRRNA
jgi:hypothetical protein